MSKREMCLVVDVETAGGFGCPLVYDLGIAVVERTTGRIVEARSFLIKEVYVDMPNLMASAYYAEKLPSYAEGIKAGAFQIVSIWEAWRTVRALVQKHGITRAYAYNASFDRKALDNTFQMLTPHGKSFLGRGVKWACIWHMACQTILSQKRYRRFALAHGFVSEYGNIRTSAECAYAYLTNRPDYAEPHTGLADVRIETEILHKVIRQHKRVDESIAYNPWRIVNKPA